MRRKIGSSASRLDINDSGERAIARICGIGEIAVEEEGRPQAVRHVSGNIEIAVKD